MKVCDKRLRRVCVWGPVQEANSAETLRLPWWRARCASDPVIIRAPPVQGTHHTWDHNLYSRVGEVT